MSISAIGQAGTISPKSPELDPARLELYIQRHKSELRCKQLFVVSQSLKCSRRKRLASLAAHTHVLSIPRPTIEGADVVIMKQQQQRRRSIPRENEEKDKEPIVLPKIAPSPVLVRRRKKRVQSIFRTAAEAETESGANNNESFTSPTPKESGPVQWQPRINFGNKL